MNKEGSLLRITRGAKGKVIGWTDGKKEYKVGKEDSLSYPIGASMELSSPLGWIKEHYKKHMHILSTGRIDVKTLKSEEFKVIEERLIEKDREIARLKEEIEAMKAEKKRINEEALKEVLRLKEILEKKGLI